MTLQRTLSTRQISMIAIGGSIGTGLFLASGNTIHLAGPGGRITFVYPNGYHGLFLNDELG